MQMAGRSRCQWLLPLALALGAAVGPAAAAGEVDESVLGMSIGDITDSVREEFKLESKQGAAILRVTRGGLAARAGIRPGDVIIKLNGQRTSGAEEFMKTYKALRSGQVLRLLVVRDGSRLYLAIRKP